MSERDDSLYTLAKLQEKPPRSMRDLTVLEAAKAKAAMNKQKLHTPVKKAESLWSYFSKPMWLGTGSLAAAALSVFIVFGHQVAPEEKVASAPVAAAPAIVASAPVTAPVAAPSPASDMTSNREEARSAPAISVKRDAAPPKKESSVQVSKQIATAEVNNTDVAKAVREPNVEVTAAPSAPVPPSPAPISVPTPVALASPPVSVEAPPAAINARVQSSAAPSGRMAVAAAPAPAVTADNVARKRESPSALVATNPCVFDIKAIPLERQTLAVESTKQLLTQCAQSVPKTQWPTDIDWARKLLDQQQEKSQ
jgi:hypothetical protein